jgi:hypothetical protein
VSSVLMGWNNVDGVGSASLMVQGARLTIGL